MDACLDLEELLPVEFIRTHTKTDDVIRVTDDQIKLYREHAFETADIYTGRKWTCLEEYSQPIRQRPSRHRFRQGQKVRLDFPAADGYIRMSGEHGNHFIRVEPGSTKVRLPYFPLVSDIMGCCDPCASSGQQGTYVHYKVGNNNKDDIPAGILVGILKYIAWMIAHPGDEIMTVRNRFAKSDSGELIGTNNGAWASGAVETWRLYRTK